MTDAETDIGERPYHIYFTREEPPNINSEGFRQIEPTLPRRIRFCTEWSELAELFKLKPQSICVNAKHFAGHSIIEIVSMIETFCNLVGSDKSLSITIGVNKDTAYSFVKEAQKTRIIGLVPSSDLDQYPPEETMRGLQAQWC